MQRMDPKALDLRPFDVLDTRWALLVAGRQRPNPMTVSWGGMGTVWNLPVATAFVRPSRFTFELIEKDRCFTLNVLPEEYRDALRLCGAKSGRDIDKWKETGLAHEPSVEVPVPRVVQAELVLECRVAAFTDIRPEGFLTDEPTAFYSSGDYHRVYFGEVLAAWRA